METFLRVRVDGRAAEGDIRRLEKRMDALERSEEKVEKRSLGVGRALGAIFSAAVITAGVRTLSTFERMKAQLVTFTGDAERAGGAFEAIADFAARTPFALEQSIDAFTKMRALGLQPTERALSSFGNTAAAMGKDLSQFIEAVADASTNEFERLKEFGIKARQQGDEVAFTFQGVTTTVQKDSEAIVEYLTNIGETNFAGAMEQQMNRLPGLLSNLGDSVQGVVRDIGDAGLTAALEGAARFAITAIDGLRSFIQNDLAAVLDFISAKFSLVWDAVKANVGDLLRSFGALFDFLFESTSDDDLLGGLLAAGEAVLDFFLELPTRFREGMTIIGAVASNVGQVVTNAWELAKSNLLEFFADIKFYGSEAWLSIKGAALTSLEIITPGFADFGADIDATAAQLANLRLEHAQTSAQAQADQLKFRVAAQDLIDSLVDEIAAIHAETEAQIAAKDAKVEAARELLRLKRNVDRTIPSLDDYAGSASEGAESTSELSAEAKELAKDFEALEERLDPQLKLNRAYADSVTTIIKAWLAGETTLERANELIALQGEAYQEAQAKLLGLKDEADPFADAWVQAAERIDESFADAWKGAFDSFSAFANSIKNALQNLLAELAHQLLTRPLLINLGLIGPGGIGTGGGGIGAGGFGLSALGPLGIAAAAGGLGGPGAGIGALAGYGFASTTFGAGLLGATGLASGTAALTGAQLGTVVPIVGTIIGAALGYAIGQLLGGDNPDPRIRVVNTQVDPAGQYGGEFARLSAFSGDTPAERLTVSGIQITETFGRDAANAFLDQVQSFDDILAEAIRQALGEEAIADVRQALLGQDITLTGNISVEDFLGQRFDVILSALDPAIAAFVESVGGNLEQRVEALGTALDFQALNESLGLFTDLGEAFEFVAQFPGDPLVTLRLLGETMAEIQANIDALSALSLTDVAEDYATAVEIANRSLLEQGQFLDSGIRELIAAGDLDAQGIAQVTTLMQQRYAVELQLLQQIDNAIANINARFGDAISQFENAGETTAQQYERLTTEAEAAAAAIASGLITDPAEIERLSLLALTRSQEAFNLLTPEQQALYGQDFATFARDLQADTLTALAAARQESLDQFTATQDLVREVVEGLPSAFDLAADALISAADEMVAIVRGDDPAPPAADPEQPISTDPVTQATRKLPKQSTEDVQVAVQAAVDEAMAGALAENRAIVNVTVGQFTGVVASLGDQQERLAQVLAGLSRHGVPVVTRRTGVNNR